MKTILKNILFYSFALYIVSKVISVLIIKGGIRTVFMAGAIFALLNFFVKPILKAISLPFLFFSLGLFAFLIDAAVMYALTRFIPDLHVHEFTIQKFTYKTYHTPSFYVDSFFAYVVLSAIIAFITIFFSWITE